MEKEVKKKCLCRAELKEHFQKGEGNAEQEKGDVKLFEFSVGTPKSQGKHKLLMTEQVLLSTTGTNWGAGCKMHFQSFRPWQISECMI